MSRLDSFIRRMSAQRDCLAAAAAQIDGLEGIVIELGLGNGRSYDHLRELLPRRDIYVFDRRVAAHRDCVPDEQFMFVGEILDQLPRAYSRLGRCAALAHSDVGSGRADLDAEVAVKLVAVLVPMMVKGGLVVSDQPFSSQELQPVPLPDSVSSDRYFMYRAL